MEKVEIKKPTVGDAVMVRGRVEATLVRRVGFGGWIARDTAGNSYRVQGLAEVDLLVLR